MQIPNNITKAHLIQAINKIDKEGVPNHADSQYYDVIHNGKRYPPKLIVSFANFAKLITFVAIINNNSLSFTTNTFCNIVSICC